MQIKHLNKLSCSRCFPLNLLQSPDLRQKMGASLWVYLALRALAKSETGRVTINSGELATFLSITSETLLSLVGRLRKEGFISIRREHANLSVTILNWERSRKVASQAASIEQEGPSATQTLAAQIASTFDDEHNIGRYENLIEDTPQIVINRAFRDASAMPEDRIRKSRAALFFYLTRKYAQQENDAM